MIRLVARGLSVTPPGASAPVVRGVDLDLARGEWVAVHGPNGSGKSSLALALAGLWPAADGTITLDGAPHGPGATRARRRIAFVGQEPSSQILQATVHDELAFGARNLDHPEGLIRARVSSWAARFGLEADLHRDPRTLSAGRQQTVLLAAALCLEPDVLIADEAAAHLDAGARGRLLEVLRGLAGSGISILWVTQDPDERSAADREVGIGDPRGGFEPNPGYRECRPAEQDPEPLLRIALGTPPAEGPRIRLPGLETFTVGRTGISVLLGPNGSGKTVLLETLAGARSLEQVQIDLRDSLEPPPILASQYPESQIFEERVYDELAFGARQRGVAEPDIQMTILQSVTGLVDDAPGFLERRTWSLSAGERRMVGVLAALVTPARLVLLDEPSAGLDPRVKAGLAGRIGERSRRSAVILSSQDPAWAGVLGRVLGGRDACPPQRQVAGKKRIDRDLSGA